MMKIFGHRGARGLAPENTLASFAKALNYGVDAIELDVHLTRDGQLVCVHDPLIPGPDGMQYHVPDYTYAELRAIQKDLPTLAQAITAIKRKVPIIVEIKKDAAGAAVAVCIQEFLDKGWRLSDFEFCSFLQSPLAEIKAAFPAAIVIPNGNWSTSRTLWRARKLGTKRISMNQRWLWRGYLRTMQRAGWQVSSYTVNNPAQVRKWEPYLYAIYTDYPDRFQR
jgi:glycerophosphoryl diester phosphodiesterase